MRSGGEEAELDMFVREELLPESMSYLQPRLPVCFPSSSVISGDVFPQPPVRGNVREALFLVSESAIFPF